MTKRILILSLVALGLTATLAGCEKNKVDTQKPTITLKAPKNGARLGIGHEEGVHFEVELADNDALHSYKVDIHSNFTPHSHTKLRHPEEGVAFSFSKSWTLDRKRNTTEHHHEIKIPANAKPGPYHLMVYCTDASGNEAHVVVEVQLVHGEGDDHHHEH